MFGVRNGVNKDGVIAYPLSPSRIPFNSPVVSFWYTSLFLKILLSWTLPGRRGTVVNVMASFIFRQIWKLTCEWRGFESMIYVFNVMCRKSLSSPRCRSELIDSAWVVIVPGQRCIKKTTTPRSIHVHHNAIAV